MNARPAPKGRRPMIWAVAASVALLLGGLIYLVIDARPAARPRCLHSQDGTLVVVRCRPSESKRDNDEITEAGFLLAARVALASGHVVLLNRGDVPGGEAEYSTVTRWEMLGKEATHQRMKMGESGPFVDAAETAVRFARRANLLAPVAGP